MAAELKRAVETGAPKAVVRASSSDRRHVASPARFAPTPDLTPPHDSGVTGAGGLPLLGSLADTTPNAPPPQGDSKLIWIVAGAVVIGLLAVWFFLRR